ncbi:SDR family oxidoreductase [Isoptericola sp. NPDC019482]|uniref:SDR family NAD(P)-dependent oxidoreductase n=1 Tax=Isoptericola sp. NPDC019482 TaxID=3154688 RepID=UPI00347E45FE
MPLDLHGTTTVVTGASSGLGAEFARVLAARGSHLVLLARRAERLDALARELEDGFGVRAHVLPLDLADDGAAAALTSFLEERSIAVDSLVNNAGFATSGAFADADAERLDREVRLNVGAVVSLTRALLGPISASGRGFVLNVSSMAAFQPIPTMAVYGATKAFVLSFTQALAHELRGTGVRVTALCPGPTRTEFFDVAESPLAASASLRSAPAVVAAGIRALDARRTPSSVVPGALNRFGAGLGRLLPRSLVVPLAARVAT